MQCMDNSGCFPLGKASSHNTALPSSPTPSPTLVCSVFVFPNYHRLWGLLFTTHGHGIFNVLTKVGACRTHEGGSTRVDSEGQKNCASPAPCPARGSNPRSSGLNSDALTTELRTYVPLCRLLYSFDASYKHDFWRRRCLLDWRAGVCVWHSWTELGFEGEGLVVNAVPGIGELTADKACVYWLTSKEHCSERFHNWKKSFLSTDTRNIHGPDVNLRAKLNTTGEEVKWCR